MAKEYDRKNPEFAIAHMGVASNHSSSVESVAREDHAQSDDAISDEGTSRDPNISGTAETQTPYTWLAGKMDGWCENDDYRTYFENSVGCDGMLGCDSHDGDYDDNGGYPLAVGHSRGVHGPAGGQEGKEYTEASFGVASVIMRRI